MAVEELTLPEAIEVIRELRDELARRRIEHRILAARAPHRAALVASVRKTRGVLLEDLDELLEAAGREEVP